MNFLFRSRPKTPAELAQILNEASLVLIAEGVPRGKVHEKAVKDVTKSLAQIKALFSDADPNLESIAELAQEAYSIGLLETICDCLPYYDFESRKSAALTFNGILKRQIGSRTPSVDYLCKQPQILHKLLRGYESKEIALNSGMMLRECLKFEQLTQLFIETGDFYSLFQYIELPTFDIASDAFATFETLLKHKALIATLFIESYDRVMPEFTKLLASENYVTRRQSLKLLVDLLADPINQDMTARFLSSSDNLKIIMTLMRDSSKTISSEAFRVFRAFLDNPLRPKAVHDILLKNQEKLLTFIDAFNKDIDDEDFNEDRQFCIAVIADLVPRPEAKNAADAHLEIS